MSNKAIHLLQESCSQWNKALHIFLPFWRETNKQRAKSLKLRKTSRTPENLFIPDRNTFLMRTTWSCIRCFRKQGTSGLKKTYIFTFLSFCRIFCRCAIFGGTRKYFSLLLTALYVRMKEQKQTNIWDVCLYCMQDFFFSGKSQLFLRYYGEWGHEFCMYTEWFRVSYN